MTRAWTAAHRAASAAGLLGSVAGLSEILVGTSRWFGSKNAPSTLGLVTIALALVIALSGRMSSRVTSTGGHLTVAVTLLVPALLGLTTAGVAWVPAAVLGLLAGGATLRRASAEGSIGAVLHDEWPVVLLVTLAVVDLALGVAAGGAVGVLGVLGGLAVIGASWWRVRSGRVAAFLLVLGTVPFAVIAWWAVVPVLTALLVLAIGLPVMLSSGSGAARPRNVRPWPARRAATTVEP